MKKEEILVIARNKKASHEYFILETYEAGIVLYGTEIKSIRNTKVSIQEAYCEVKQGEMYIQNMHISPYEKGNITEKELSRIEQIVRNVMSYGFDLNIGYSYCVNWNVVKRFLSVQNAQSCRLKCSADAKKSQSR
mgnify:CR=1 FL=1